MQSHRAAKSRPQGPFPTVATMANEPQSEILNRQSRPGRDKNAKGE